MSYIHKAKAIINQEANALLKMQEFLTEDFDQSVQAILNSKGRVVITGIGKSAIIAQKIVATFNSTGTPSLFMHAADAIHGDLGMIQQDDVVIIISKSGESPEIKALIPLIQHFGNPIIAITGNTTSFLAQGANYVLDTTIDEEADPNNLAPTTSTTAQLVMGDCLAVCLLEAKGFEARDFAKYHPGGALGKRLYLTAGDLCKKNEKPQVDANANLKDIIISITSGRLGMTTVIENGMIVGIITDGDIRRILQKNELTLSAKDYASKHAKQIDANELAVKALEIIRAHNISQIIVTQNNTYYGVLHIHNIIDEGII